MGLNIKIESVYSNLVKNNEDLRNALHLAYPSGTARDNIFNEGAVMVLLSGVDKLIALGFEPQRR